MSGILDSKTRVLDSIITLEGRKQLATGGINIRYVTFTDAATFYAADLVSGSADATVRLYLEACHLPQDQVTFQADSLGRISPFDNSIKLGVGIKSGQLLEYSFTAPEPSTIITGSIRPMASTQAMSGTSLHSYVDGLLTSSIDNFRRQQAIATYDTIFDDEGFGLGNKEIEFVIHDERPIPSSAGHTANINHLEDIYSDPRFSNFPNFKYLPPINKLDDQSIDKSKARALSQYALGNYKSWGNTEKINHVNVLTEHEQYAKMGYSRTISFDPTSRSNNLFIQAFEVTNDTMFKLDIIDFGAWYNKPVENQALRSTDQNQVGTTTHIFFIGKLVQKTETGTNSFIHLFTMIFG